MPNQINPFNYNIDNFDSGFLGPITDSNFRTFLYTHNLSSVNPVIQTILGGNATQGRGSEYDISQSTFNVVDVPNLQNVANTPSVYNNLTNPRAVSLTKNLPSIDTNIANNIGVSTLTEAGLGTDVATDISSGDESIKDLPNVSVVANIPSVYNNQTNPTDLNLNKNPSLNELTNWHPDYAYWFNFERDTYKTSFGVPNTLKLGGVGDIDQWVVDGSYTSSIYEIRDLGYFKQNNKYGPEKIISYKSNNTAKPVGFEQEPNLEVLDDNTGSKSYNYADSIGEKLVDQLLNRQIGVGVIPFSTLGSGINFKPDGEITELDKIARKRRGVELLNRIKLNVIGDTIGRVNLDPVSLLSGGDLIEQDYTITQRKSGTIGIPGTGGRTTKNPLDLLSSITGFNIPVSPLTQGDLENIFTFYGKKNSNIQQDYLSSVSKANSKFLKKFGNKNTPTTSTGGSPPIPPSSKITEAPLQMNQNDIPESLLSRTGSSTRKLILDSLDENKYSPNIENKGATVLKNYKKQVSQGNYLNEITESEITKDKSSVPNADNSSLLITPVKPGYFGNTEPEKHNTESTSDSLGFIYDETPVIDKSILQHPTTYQGTNVSQSSFDIVGTEKFNWKRESNNLFKRGLLRYTQQIVNQKCLEQNGGYIGYFDSDESGVSDVQNPGEKCINCGHKTGSFVNQTLTKPSKGNQSRNVRLTKDGNVDNKSGDRYCRSWTSRRKYDDRAKFIRNDGTWWRDNLNNTDLTMNWDGNNGGIFSNMPKITWNNLDKLEKNNESKMIPYMLSIENLAWKGSPHFDKLMDCEKGPNGGRIMWFPPYNIDFSDSSSVSWDTTSFIGRGEPIYTYNHSERSGTLDFTIIVDHPDVLNGLTNRLQDNLSDDVLHSFFAGCDDNTIREFFSQKIPPPEKIKPPKKKIIPDPDPLDFELPKEIKYYFDNAFTSKNKNDETQSGRFINEKYEIDVPDSKLTEADWNNPAICPCGPGGTYSYNPLNLIDPYSKFAAFGGNKTRLDLLEDFATWLVTTEEGKNCRIFIKATTSPSDNESVKSGDYNAVLAKDRYDNSKKYLYDKMVEIEEGLEPICIGSEKKYCYPKEKDMKDMSSRWQPFDLKNSITNYSFQKVKDEFFGSDPNVTVESIKKEFSLNFTDDAPGKGNPCATYGITNGNDKGANNKSNHVSYNNDAFLSPLTSGITLSIGRPNSPIAKQTRYVEFSAKKNTNSDCIQKLLKDGDTPTRASLNKCWKQDLEKGADEAYKKEQENIDKQNQILDEEYKKKIAKNYIRECDYFEALKKESPVVYTSLTEKIRNFHPAFHSMTPEGLNTRLTFLLQCTKQGPQVIDPNLPSNMVFGRPPICVLRIGDFYHTKIVIDNVNLTYEPLQWDLNPEGIGVQPMVTKVSISFKFIGGSSLGGPISQLQNAVSFNFFANTSIYEPATLYTSDRINFIYGAFRSPANEKDLMNQLSTKLMEDAQTKIETQNQDVVSTETETKPAASNVNTEEMPKDNSGASKPPVPPVKGNKLDDVLYEANYSGDNYKKDGGTVTSKKTPSIYGILMDEKTTALFPFVTMVQKYIKFDDKGNFYVWVINTTSGVVKSKVVSVTGKYYNFNQGSELTLSTNNPAKIIKAPSLTLLVNKLVQKEENGDI